MPDRRRHRGPHPDDARAFAPEAVRVLREAVADLCWLYSRGYAQTSSVKLVGDRYALTDRQRAAVMRCACSDDAMASRRGHEVAIGDLAGAAVQVDGYNVLTTVEAALAGGVLLEGRDGCYRDMASMGGRFHWVEETASAVEWIGRVLEATGARDIHWLLDRPVSNSGKLACLLRETAAARQWPWRVELVVDPDAVLAKGEAVAATADSAILDRCGRWVNLGRAVVSRAAPGARVVRLGDHLR
ncbi:MAG TPA: DUF434 domain-containing protein [Verrucomicrobiae bacterium]|nr:DUF434 domain-containing protein [Verrucomicrobiae bacterium]